jgi:heat shock protein HslJ
MVATLNLDVTGSTYKACEDEAVATAKKFFGVDDVLVTQALCTDEARQTHAGGSTIVSFSAEFTLTPA